MTVHRKSGRVSLRRASPEASLVSVTVMPLLVVLDAPLVRAFIRAGVADKLGLGVHALELPVAPERPVGHVSLSAVGANETPLHGVEVPSSWLVLLVAPREPVQRLERVDALVRPRKG